MNVSFLFKDLLSFEEVAEYLESQGYYYNINNEYDYNRLRNFIVDLYHERKLMPLFFYSGWGVVTVVNKKDIEVIDSREAYLKGYFGVVEIGEILRKILKEGKVINIKEYECYHYSPDDIARLPIHGDDVYSAGDSTSLTTVEFEVGKPSFFITFDDLRYSKKVFERLFNINQIDEQSQRLIEAQAKIADLENQLTQVKADKPASINNDKSPYVTPAINIMNEVITEFWIDYDPNDPAPKQSTITEWITNNFEGVSDALALNIDKVCRHTSARSGGKYKR